MTNISFYFKPTFLEKELGKIYLNPNETNSNYIDEIKTRVLKGINSYRKKSQIFPIECVYIGILGQNNIQTDLEDDKNIFKLLIHYNSDTNEYDYYYNGEKVNI